MKFITGKIQLLLEQNYESFSSFAKFFFNVKIHSKLLIKLKRRSLLVELKTKEDGIGPIEGRMKVSEAIKQ